MFPLTLLRTSGNQANGWQMDCPHDPSSIVSTEQQCQLCSLSMCDCIATNVLRVVPLTVPASDMGKGVQAITPYAVGEQVGELVPLGQHQDGWTADFCRDDLDNKFQAVCQVYCRNMGNGFRKVNHSCSLNSGFLPLLISGWCRIMISVNYGDDYWSSGPCLYNSSNCVSRR